MDGLGDGVLVEAPQLPTTELNFLRVMSFGLLQVTMRLMVWDLANRERVWIRIWLHCQHNGKRRSFRRWLAGMMSGFPYLHLMITKPLCDKLCAAEYVIASSFVV